MAAPSRLDLDAEKGGDAVLTRTASYDGHSLLAVVTGGQRPACFKSTLHEVAFVLTATMAIATSALLSGAIVVISSFAGRDLHMTTAEITWLNSATSLTAGAFLLFFGRFADLFGRKILFVGSMFLFAVFALVAGFAKTPISLDIYAGVLGLFSASAVPPAQGILSLAYSTPGRRKNAAFACFSAGNPLGFVFGTIFGGIASTLFGWRAAFWLIAIIFLALTVAGIFIVPKDPTDKDPLNWESIKKFDVVGTALTISGVGMFCAALTSGGTAPQGWRTPYVLALLIVGILLLVTFVFWELHFPYPLMPMHIWKDRNFSLSLIILTMGMASFTPAAFFMSLYWQDVKHMSSLMVGVHLLPMAINGMIVNAIAGLVLHRVSNKILMYLGAGGYATAFLLLSVNRSSTSFWALFFPAQLFMVVGADLEFNVANMYVMSSMDSSQQSVAGGIFQTAVRLMNSVGLGIATAVFDAVQKDRSLSTYWDTAVQPYTAVFWYAFTLSALSVCLVPFLTLKTQGGKTTVDSRAESPHSQRSSDSEKRIEG